MHEISISFDIGHELQAYHEDVDAIAHNAIGEDCAGVSIGADSVRIHLEDGTSEDDPAVTSAVDAIIVFYNELQG